MGNGWLFFSVSFFYLCYLSVRVLHPPIDHLIIFMGQLFKTFNLDQNDQDLEIPFFPIQDQVIRLTFMPVFQSNIGLDHPDPDKKDNFYFIFYFTTE